MDIPAREQERIEKALQLLCLRSQDGAFPPQEQENAAVLARFLDEMPGGFLIYRAAPGEGIVYANRGLLRILGCDTMEDFRTLTGDSFRGIVHPDDLERVEESIREQIRADRYDLDYVEYRIRRRDGEIRWIEDYGHFVRTEALGNLFYVFLADATEKRSRLLDENQTLMSEKREKEQKIRTLTEGYDKERSLISQAYLRQLEVIDGLSVTYETICFADLDDDQVLPYRMSERAQELFDEQPKPYSWFARNYAAMWVHPEDQDMVAETTSIEHIRARLAESRTFYFNYRVLMKGAVQYMQLRVVHVGKTEDSCQIVLGYRRVDEEMQRQLEQQSLLAEALERANLAINSRNAFLSNMSHDMRTPLHTIFGLTALARRTLKSQDEAFGYLDRLETAGRQLLDMIEKVLEITELSAGPPSLKDTACDLRETAQKVYDFLKPQATEKDITFLLDCRGLRHSSIYSDPEKLRQLLLYLTNNAITYTNPGGRVIISISEGETLPNQHAVYQLSVKDNGAGIRPEFLERVFEPFTREKNSTLSGVHGIGLGLTIAKSIVDMMGGEISIQSEPGAGSTFTATLSFRTQPNDDTERKINSSGEETLRILLAEDNELNREIETELLENLGFLIDPVENGLLAFEKMRDSEPGYYDAVLLDLQMPVMDGWQAAQKIRQLENPELSRVPIIALSANVLESDRQRSFASGIDAHLGKPMDMPLLLNTIRDLAGTPQ